jgi:hypothetical protein
MRVDSSAFASLHRLPITLPYTAEATYAALIAPNVSGPLSESPSEPEMMAGTPAIAAPEMSAASALPPDSQSK